MLFLDPPHTPGEDLAIQGVISLLQAASFSPICRNSRSPRCFFMRASKLLSPPPSLGVTSQLCHSSVSRPNSALGRGGIPAGPFSLDLLISRHFHPQNCRSLDVFLFLPPFQVNYRDFCAQKSQLQNQQLHKYSNQPVYHQQSFEVTEITCFPHSNG